MVAAAADLSSGRYTAAWIRTYAERGQWQIWIAMDEIGICAVAGTELVTYDTGLKALAVKFGTGRNRDSWQHLMNDVVAWGASQGCKLNEGGFRIGWKRVLRGWNHTHDFLERAN